MNIDVIEASNKIEFQLDLWIELVLPVAVFHSPERSNQVVSLYSGTARLQRLQQTSSP